jgi:hypothetical protein
MYFNPLFTTANLFKFTNAPGFDLLYQSLNNDVAALADRPKLNFHPVNLFAMGSPIGVFSLFRDYHSIHLNPKPLGTCKVVFIMFDVVVNVSITTTTTTSTTTNTTTTTLQRNVMSIVGRGSS